MSRRHGWPTAGVAVGALLAFAPPPRAASTVGPPSAAATSPERLHQDTVSDEARLLERLDTLRRRMAALQPSEDEPLVLDTVTVRGVRVVAPADDTARGRIDVDEWMARAVRGIEDRIGPLPPLPDTPTIKVDLRPVTVSMAADTGWIRLFGPSPFFSTERLAGAVDRALTSRLPEPVRDWLAGPLAAPSRPYPASTAYSELAWSPLWLERACLGGDERACAVALGLEPLDTLDLATEHREQLRAAYATARPPQQLSGGRVAVLSTEARRNFLQHIVRTRPDALAVLLSPEWTARDAAGSADVKALLEAAAGTRMEVILEGWVEELRAARGGRLPARVVASSLIWILLFAGLATRSTRWRAG